MTKEMLREKSAALCSALIRAESVSGKEQAVAEVLRQAMLSLGFDSVQIDVHGNVIGCIHGKRQGKRVLLDGHIDTVPVTTPEEWSFPPFGGELRGDRICGRGATDMKGAVAAMTCAAAYFAERCNHDFCGDIYVAGVVFEELFEGIACRAISEAVQPDFVIIGEASELNLKIGQRGRAEIVVETYGRPAHSANPEKGVNAVKKMMALLAEIEQIPAHVQPELGKGILELTDIISAPYPGSSVVPERCTATFDRRLLVGDTKTEILRPIQEKIDLLRARDPDFSARVYLREAEGRCYTGDGIREARFFPAWYFSRELPWVEKIYRGLCAAGLQPEVTTYSFCTNGSHYAGERGIPTVGFGPSQECLAHTVDEYILLDELYKAADGYDGILSALLL